MCETQTCGCKLNVLDEARDVVEAKVGILSSDDVCIPHGGSFQSGTDKDGACRAIGGKCSRPPENPFEWIIHHFAGKYI